MHDDSALLRLATRAGIETHWRDVWGRDRAVPSRSVAALLDALGVDAEAQAAAANRPALCEPVTVVAAEAPFIALPVAPSAAGSEAWLEWCLADEGGTRREGAVAIDDMPFADDAAAEAPGRRRRVLRLSPAQPGYYTLALRCGRRHGQASLIVAPRRCYLPEALERGQHLVVREKRRQERELRHVAARDGQARREGNRDEEPCGPPQPGPEARSENDTER